MSKPSTKDNGSETGPEIKKTERIVKISVLKYLNNNKSFTDKERKRIISVFKHITMTQNNWDKETDKFLHARVR